MKNDKSVVIVGAGIHGLTTALVLTETGGFGAIKIYSKEPVAATTSCVAGGLIEPAFVAEGDARINAWFAASRARLRDLLADPRWYIRQGPVRTLWRWEKSSPAWAGLVDGFTSRPGPLAPYAREWTYATEIVETPRHIAELVRRLRERGVQIVEREVRSLGELAEEAQVVINCSGVGARQLGDAGVVPARGQVVILERSAKIPDEVVVEDAMLTYVIPRITDVIVGGTYELGDWSREPRPAVADDIMLRALELMPQLQGASVLSHRAGLRPVRDPAPRLDVEISASGTVLAHCYGTAGAGITLSYGMAADLVARLRAALSV